MDERTDDFLEEIELIKTETRPNLSVYKRMILEVSPYFRALKTIALLE